MNGTVFPCDFSVTQDSMSEHRPFYEQQLTRLKRAIVRIPASVPDGAEDGLIAQNFGQIPIADEDGPYKSLNVPWDRVFQRPEEEKKALVVKGRYGLACIIPFVEAVAAMPGIELNGTIYLVGVRLQQLTDFLEKELVLLIYFYPPMFNHI